MIELVVVVDDAIVVVGVLIVEVTADTRVVLSGVNTKSLRIMLLLLILLLLLLI
jgi:hypothetical protein